MTVSQKIKTINNNIEETIGQYNLFGKTAKISSLSSENVGRLEF